MGAARGERMTSADRRKHSRVRAQDVAGHLRVRDDVLAFGLPIDNISMGGLFVHTSEPLPMGTPLQMELTQPGLAPPIKVMGTVVLTVSPEQSATTGAKAGMGVRFDPLAPDVTKRLSVMLVELVARQGATGHGHGSGTPGNLDEATQASRKAFDFGFISLESFGEEGPPGGASDAAGNPSMHRAIAGFEVPNAAAAGSPTAGDVLSAAPGARPQTHGAAHATSATRDHGAQVTSAAQEQVGARPASAAPGQAGPQGDPRARGPVGSHPGQGPQSQSGGQVASAAQRAAGGAPASGAHPGGSGSPTAAPDAAARPAHAAPLGGAAPTAHGARPQATNEAPPSGPRPGQYQPPQRVAVTLDPAAARVGAPVIAPPRAGTPTAEPPPPLPENARLLVQIRGLLEDLGETQSELQRRSRAIDELEAEVRRLNDELRRRDERIAALEERLGRSGG